MAGVTAKCNSNCESSTSEGTNGESLCRDNRTTAQPQASSRLSQSTYTHVKLSLADNQQYLYESAATAVAAAMTVSHQCMANVAQ